ncbi:TIGR03761 family integrating conjugative element protein [Salmonella enterica]|nr:TIGR03761 family integrating conjugative element protein [Salmonella enterica]ELW6564718.1 TIGR03761 family integrating conjugative element protein [Salmonella enterica]ELZ1404356.1 TIGR03761 family integrating conjugative element protein [Salmonella enterica]
MNENERAATSADKAEHLTESPRSEAGALRSEMNIELHTRYAILLWEGQEIEKKEKGRIVRHRRIIGMPFFLHLVGVINGDSYRDNPFADQTMLMLEDEFHRGIEAINGLIKQLDHILQDIPARISLTEVLSVSPVNISVFSRTPVGYRCVWLLVGFDQLALKAFQAYHYGLISRSRRDDFLNQGSRFIRRAYGRALGYRSLSVTRQDAFENTAVFQEAMNRFGEVDPAVMLGTKRSSFSPPVNRRSIDSLKRGYFEDDKRPEAPVITAGTGDTLVRNTTEQLPDSNGSPESGYAQALSQTQTEEASTQDDGRRELTDEVDIDIDDLSVLLPPSADEPE